MKESLLRIKIYKSFQSMYDSENNKHILGISNLYFVDRMLPADFLLSERNHFRDQYFTKILTFNKCVSRYFYTFAIAVLSLTYSPRDNQFYGRRSLFQFLSRVEKKADHPITTYFSSAIRREGTDVLCGNVQVTFVIL